MTITELAKLAHVSTSTVSKAFAFLPDVSEQTRNMIFEVAKANGCFKKFYRSEYPGLAFAVICPEFESTYYASCVSEMQRLFSHYNCEVAVAATGFDPETERRLIEYYCRYNTVDGIVLIDGVSSIPPKNEIPIATIRSKEGCEGDIHVRIDLQNAVDSVVAYWATEGVTDVGFIGDRHTDGRLEMLKTALSRACLAQNESYLVKGLGRFEECGYVGALELMARERLPHAIFCAYDRIAAGAIRAFADKGIRVPEDIAVFSIDDAPGSRYSMPSITSVGYRMDETCRFVADALMAFVKGEPFEVGLEVKPVPIYRESSRIRKDLHPTKE